MVTLSYCNDRPKVESQKITKFNNGGITNTLIPIFRKYYFRLFKYENIFISSLCFSKGRK